MNNFATQPDFSQELSNVTVEINTLRQEVKVMNAYTKTDIIRWVVSVGILQMGLIAALILKIVH